MAQKPQLPKTGSTVKKSVGGWTAQDLANPQVQATAKELAIVATKDVNREKGLRFSWSEPTIEVRRFQSQVVNGTNYIIEYSVEDREGDHILFNTATMYRPLGAQASQAEVVSKDYALENINKQPGGTSGQTPDKNGQMATSNHNGMMTAGRPIGPKKRGI